MSQPTDLERGAYSGKETKLYYNSGTHASPTWVEITRARNIQRTRGPSLSEIEFHGAEETGNIPGYKKFSGSFEYARRKGADAVYDALIACRDSGGILDVCHLNGPVNDAASKGWRAPVLLGETQGTANGGEGATESFNFAKADCYDGSGNAVNVVPFTGS